MIASLRKKASDLYKVNEVNGWPKIKNSQFLSTSEGMQQRSNIIFSNIDRINLKTYLNDVALTK